MTVAILHAIDYRGVAPMDETVNFVNRIVVGALTVLMATGIIGAVSMYGRITALEMQAATISTILSDYGRRLQDCERNSGRMRGETATKTSK